MAELGQNRVYDMGQIEILNSTAVRLLDTGIDSCREWDRVVSELKSLQVQTPIKSSQLSGALNGISGKMYQSDFETDKCWVESALNNVITNIPQQDIAGASLLEPLNENLQFVLGMIEDLEGCIEGVGINLNLAEFEGRVEGIKRDWEQNSLEENMEAFESRYLGMVENVSYSEDLLSGIEGGTTRDSNDGLFVVYDAMARLSNIPNSVINKDALEELERMYGFTEAEALLLYDAIESLGKSCNFERNSAAYINYVYGTLSTLCISYDAKRWRLTAETPNLYQAKNRLYAAGFSSQQILDLQVLINLQHGDFSDERLMNSKIDIDKSTFSNETHAAMMARCSDQYNDFSHQTIQITEFACEDMVLEEGYILLGPWAVGLFNSSDFQHSYTKYEISFKGDIDSGRYSKADFQSDIDAINIYSRMRNDDKTSLNQLWTTYYKEVELGDTNRAAEFFCNLGNGEEDVGIIELDNILNKETFGSEYIQKGNDMSKEDIEKIRSVFVQWIFSEYYGYEYTFPE